MKKTTKVIIMVNNMKNINKKRLDTVRYFVDVGYRISEKEGFSSITVRNLAKEANYNSSSIYYYFPDFDYLLHYVALRYLNNFFNKLHNIEEDYINSLDLHVKVFNNFISSIVQFPEQFQNIIYSKHFNQIEDILDNYSIIYPNQYKKNIIIFPILEKNNKAIIPTLDLCVCSGYIKAKSKYKIIELTDSIIHSLILNAQSIDNPKELKNIENRYKEYIFMFIQNYKTPIGMLDYTEL